MTQEIVCIPCFNELKRIAGDHMESTPGMLKVEYNCDFCGIPIAKNAPGVALSRNSSHNPCQKNWYLPLLEVPND